MGDERTRKDGDIAARGDRETLRDGTIAVLDDSLLTAVGGHSKSVYLSPETATRQAVRHPDIRAGDYARVQYLVDQGVAILEKDRTIVLAGTDDKGKCWRAVVKRTADRRATYLVTFHRIKPGQIAAARRRGTVVRPGRGEAVALGVAQSFPRAAGATGLGLGSSTMTNIHRSRSEPQADFACAAAPRFRERGAGP